MTCYSSLESILLKMTIHIFLSNKQYLISWLQEINLEQLHFEQNTFSEHFVFIDIYYLEKTSFFVL